MDVEQQQQQQHKAVTKSNPALPSPLCLGSPSILRKTTSVSSWMLLPLSGSSSMLKERTLSLSLHDTFHVHHSLQQEFNLLDGPQQKVTVLLGQHGRSIQAAKIACRHHLPAENTGSTSSKACTYSSIAAASLS
jgi:hypothetical protein